MSSCGKENAALSDRIEQRGILTSSPTATDDELGTGKWSAGPTFVVFFDDRPLHLTTGFLINNLWSYAGDEDRSDVNAMTLQPFLNYILPKGWYLSTSPVITANWEANSDNRWTVPSAVALGASSRSVINRSTLN